MSQIKGTNISAPVVPFTSNDSYPTHIDTYGKGGYRAVKTYNALKTEAKLGSTPKPDDWISPDRLSEGMLVYVIDDDRTYQWGKEEENGPLKWIDSKVGGGVTKIEDITNDNSGRIWKEGDVIFNIADKTLYVYVSGKWKPIQDNSFSGVPIYTESQVLTMTAADKLPEDYIVIPDPSAVEFTPTTTSWEDTGAGTYLDILFKSLRKLQAEVAKLRNSFKYGINSECGTETATTGEYADEDIPTREPLWATEESDLSGLETPLNLESMKTKEVGEFTGSDWNVEAGSDGEYLVVSGNNVHWREVGEGFSSRTNDVKQYLFITSSTKNLSLAISYPYDSSTVEKVIDFSGIRDLGSVTGIGGQERWNIIIILNRQQKRPDGEFYGDPNYLYLSFRDAWNSKNEWSGYYYEEEEGSTYVGHLSSTQKILLDKQNLNISGVNFPNGETTLWRFNGYTKYQDLSHGILPVKPEEDEYKFKAAHITIRSVETKVVLDRIKDRLQTNELIYIERDSSIAKGDGKNDTFGGTLFIKTQNNAVKPISGGGGSDGGSTDEDGMDIQDLIQTLKNNGINITGNGSEPVTIDNLADITFIHEASGKQYKIAVNSEGKLTSTELPSESIHEKLEKQGDLERFSTYKTVNEIPSNSNWTSRSYVGGFLRQLNCYFGKLSTDTADAKLLADRVRISEVYVPKSDQERYGCSHAFIELENTSNVDFLLDDCYVCTATREGDVKSLKLSGKIPAGGTYLIRGKKYTDYTKAYVKIKTFDVEWYDGKDLIDLTTYGTSWREFALVFGSPCEKGDVLYSGGHNILTDPKPSVFKDENIYIPNYIDSFVIYGSGNMDYNWIKSNDKTFVLSDNTIYKNTFELDPAKQAFQGLYSKDSSRIRNANVNDFQNLSLDFPTISFPKSDEICPVSKFTPRASWEEKNVCTDKTQMNLEQPNMVTVSFGIDISTTRCFNWISADYYNEYIWIRPKGTTEWTCRFESYKGEGTEWDDTGTSGWTKKSFNPETEEATIKEKIYNRINGVFPGVGQRYTAHKCIIHRNPINSGSKVVYEYIVGRAGKSGNPDLLHTSEVQTFTMYPSDWKPRVYQITDQQGFHWIEYQVWSASAKHINNKIIEECSGENVIPVLINTGDMTQNGTRINEWLDYYNGGYCLFNHLEQMNVVGNNDLCDIDPEILGTGDDSGKSNSFYFHVFYCYEVYNLNWTVSDITRKVNPIINGKYIPSLYYFYTSDILFLMVNSEVTEKYCNEVLNLRDSTKTINVYTGYFIGTGSEYVSDSSNVYLYEQIYQILDQHKSSGKTVIAVCHEMPFTVVTAGNLTVGTANSDRSLSGGKLVGSHLNHISASGAEEGSINWFSRLLENFNVKLCIGGHKHTYSCTFPLREFYKHGDKFSIPDAEITGSGKMEMQPTLASDKTTTKWVIKRGDFSGLGISMAGSSSDDTINTTKFPIVYNTEASPGITISSTEVGNPITPVCYNNTNIASGYYGVVYFMCQATGYKLTSNKELPGNEQKFSFLLPKTEGSNPATEQQYPMYSVIEWSDIDTNDDGHTDESYLNIYLRRVENIKHKEGNKFYFTQQSYGTSNIDELSLNHPTASSIATYPLDTYETNLTEQGGPNNLVPWSNHSNPLIRIKI